MAYEFMQCGTTEFAIDWSVVRRMVRSYYTAYHQLTCAQEVTLSDSRWYNPMSWSLPDVTHLEVDWEAVNRYVEANTDQELQEMRARAKSNAAGVAHRLEWMIEAAGRNKEDFVDWMGDLQTRNMRSINQAVADYESKVEVARFVRDSSADGLMVGASVMSGGTAAAVMGAGSFLKGESKWQDTGSVGAGVMEGAGSLVFAYVKLGKTFSFKQDMVLALVQAGWKTGTELVSGAALAKAATSGALKLTGPTVDRLLQLAPARTLFDKVAVPLVITYDGQNVASKVLSKFAGAMAQKRGIEGAGKNALLGQGSTSGTGSSANGSPRRQGSVIAQATLTSKYLLYFAFVNMNTGIGRGW